MKVLAAISAFIFTALAAWFGVAFSTQKTSLVPTATAILVAVFINSTLHGVVFGRRAVAVMTGASASALVLLWLPMLMFATSDWVMESAVALAISVVAALAGAFVGSFVGFKVKR